MFRMIQVVGLAFALAAGFAEEVPRGAALLKTDLMFVGAHPDDETGVAATLARIRQRALGSPTSALL